MVGGGNDHYLLGAVRELTSADRRPVSAPPRQHRPELPRERTATTTRWG